MELNVCLIQLPRSDHVMIQFDDGREVFQCFHLFEFGNSFKVIHQTGVRGGSVRAVNRS